MLVSPGRLMGPYPGPGDGGGPVVLTGQLWTTGFGYLGYLGDGTTVDKSSPVQVGALESWTKISSGADYFAGGINESGELFMWGSGGSGRLGDGTTVSKSSPVQVGALTDWAELALSLSTSITIKTDGTLWTWGEGSDSCLGNGSSLDLSSPTQVGVLTDWEQIEAGKTHVLATKTDGTLWAWGRNSRGELGDGSVTTRNSPVQIGALTDWAQVSAGTEVSAAVKTDGTLWTWGDSDVGKLGNGTSTPHISSPVQIGALTDWESVSCATEHMLAVKTDGTLWAWGWGFKGVLGDGTTVDKSSPIQVGALTDWAQVSAGADWSSGAVKTDGTLWTWGFGNKGGLGHGNTATYSSPVQVGATTDYIYVAMGASQSMALRNV